MDSPAYWMPPQNSTIHGPSMTHPFDHQMTLTNRQYASRHLVAKELPPFSGKAEEWPGFISQFENTTLTCGYSNSENQSRLQRCLKGRALEAVSYRLMMPELVPDVIETLRNLFGRPEMILSSLLQKIRNEPSPKQDKLESIISFALSVQDLCSVMEASGLTDHLRNPMLVQELVDKLPAQMKLNWSLYRQSLNDTDLKTFGSWLSCMSRAASAVTSHVATSDSDARTDRRSSRGHVNAHIQPSTSDREDVHAIEEEFRKLSRDERWNEVHKRGLCRTCLFEQHPQFKCPSAKRCGENGCKRWHHKLLHKENSTEIPPETPAPCNAHKPADNSTILFRIVPVTLYSSKRQIDTFAFLDDGSSLTMLEESAAAELELEGTPDSLCLKWTADQLREEKDSRRVSLEIAGSYSNSRRYRLHDVRTVKQLSLPRQNVNSSELIEAYPHLGGLPIASYVNAVPRILIGLDNWKLGLPTAVKEGKWREPVAAKTRLGWTVHGYHHHREANQEWNGIHQCSCKRDVDLHALIKDFFSLENFGVQTTNTVPQSEEVKRARMIMEQTTVRNDLRYETGLLWRSDLIELPDSRAMAKRRLQCLERRMRSDEELATNLRQQIKDYVTKGYARKLSAEEISQKHSREWYLPIFVVKNPNKPGKVRLVWDAAAKVNGVSLNSALLKGPDLLTCLPEVLFGFRQEAVAICGDIKEMFHQVRISPNDQHSQRFLWRDCESQPEPDAYVMQVMTFGATCAPSSAQFVKNLNANRFQQKFPRAVDAIVDHHYVDDLLYSVATIEEAITLAKEVREIHRQGGFEIRNWMSNADEVVNALGENQTKKMRNLESDTEGAAEKVLGLWWCIQEDAFTYSLSLNKIAKDLLNGKRRPTKREVLRTVMSIFDPLGFLAAFLVFAKILLQEIWRSAIGWDEQINDEQQQQWFRWVNVLPAITKVRVPRYYAQNMPSLPMSIELHVFVDASENAYAAVGYFRLSAGQHVECALVAAKTKVAPLQPMSIPRLELQAAILGARLANSILQGHSLQAKRLILWTDSKTVLCWLRSDPKKFRQFVSFRVGEILEATELENWRWVPTSLNVADEATKWQRTPELLPESQWFTGPSFLKFDEEHWPSLPLRNLSSTIEKAELRTHAAHVILEPPCTVDANRLSRWKRLLHAQARVIRMARYLQARVHSEDRPTGPLEAEELLLAEKFLFRRAQFECFKDSLLKLDTDNLTKSDSLHRYNPYIDEDGLIRMRGRIDHARGVDLDVKRPIILPSQHRITYLIIADYHERFHHVNNETIVNELRQRFVIAKLRRLTKTVKSSCRKCKVRNALPTPPMMASLPPARLAGFTRPFTFVGVDCFGPMTVVIGRRTEKRWGMLFTCLTIRAIHVEVAHSMSADSCLMCLRSFMARRGTPAEIYSDNGTNFHGANNELKTILQQAQNQSQHAIIKWIFNPPASPHMGGSWERLIGSVKRALSQIMPVHHHPSDEALRALLTEVEGVVNARPLTHVSLEQDDDEALTPNHFLLGTSSGVRTPGEFSDSDLHSRKSWRKTQHLTNMFWQRWTKEYLPTLTRRSKWNLKTKNIVVGDIVIVVDGNLPRNQWPKGRVIKTSPGEDGIVRRATVETQHAIFDRPAVKLAVLDVLKDEVKPIESEDLTGGRMSPNELQNTSSTQI